MVCKQVSLALYRDALAAGVKKAILDNDRVQIVSPNAWNGNFVGEGKISENSRVDSM